MSEAPKNRKRFERNRKTGSRSVQKKTREAVGQRRERDVEKKKKGCLCLCKWWHKLVLSFVHTCAKEQLQKKNRTPSLRDTFTWKKRRKKKKRNASICVDTFKRKECYSSPRNAAASRRHQKSCPLTVADLTNRFYCYSAVQKRACRRQ